MKWVTIPSYPNYSISDEGQVCNNSTSKMLSHRYLRSGSSPIGPVVNLHSNSGTVTYYVKFLMACAFLGVDINARPRPTIDYVNGNKEDNRLCNIQIRSTLSLSNERWKRIPDFPRYWISNLGRVKREEYVDISERCDSGAIVNKHYGEILVHSSLKGSILEVNLSRDKQQYTRSVALLVAKAFLPGNGNCVSHKDGDNTNNKVDNLVWGNKCRKTKRRN